MPLAASVLVHRSPGQKNRMNHHHACIRAWKRELEFRESQKETTGKLATRAAEICTQQDAVRTNEIGARVTDGYQGSGKTGVAAAADC